MAFVAFDSALSRLGCSILTSDIGGQSMPAERHPWGG